MKNEIEFKLQSYFEKKLSRKLKTQELMLQQTAENLSGWETEIYCFQINSNIFGYGNIVLRIYPHFNFGYRAHKEFRVMKWLKGKDFPVPEVLLVESENNIFSKPFIIMEEIKGKTLTEVLKNKSETQYTQYMRKFTKILFILHSLKTDDFNEELKEYSLGTVLTYYLSRVKNLIDESKLTYLNPIYLWLKRKSKVVQVDRLTLIHGDYHTDNVLVDEKGHFYVIDWSSSAIVDFRFDLAWTMVLARLYIGKNHKDNFFKEYENIKGQSIDDIDFFEVMALLRRLMDVLKLLTEKPEETGMREGTTYIIKSQKDLIKKLMDIIYEYTKIRIDIDISTLMHE